MIASAVTFRTERMGLPETRPFGSTSSRTVSFAAGAFAAAVGATVLAGWIFDIPALKGIVDDITMKPNMAIGLIASGLSLLWFAQQARYLERLGTAVTILPGVIGGLTMIEHIFGWNLGIDQLLFTEPSGAPATASPGRMGPNGSLNLILASAALLALRRGTHTATTSAQVMAAIMAVLSTIGLVGYFYGAQELYEIARFTGIAFPTTVTLLVLSIGIMAANPRVGPISVITGDGPGAIMARRLLIPAIAVPLVLGYFRGLGQRVGLYDTGLGTAIFAMSLVAVFVALIWRTAQLMNTADEDRKRAETASRASERSFSDVFRSLPIAVALTRFDDGVIVDVNEAFTTMMGFTHDEVVGKTGIALGLNRDHEARQRLIDQLRRHCVVRNAEIQTVTKAGEKRDVLVNLNLIEMQGAKHILSTIVDITERKDLEAHQAAAREAAEFANHLKDQFLAMVSHELRTPLNAILGYARMLHTNAIPPDKRARAIEIIERNAAAQNRLVEDLLDISRITTGKVRLETQPVFVITPLQEALESVRPAAEAKRIKIEIEADPFTPRVNGDPNRLQQIFWNVLSNAVKFTPEDGSIAVTLDMENTFVRVTVRDTGIGIAAEFMPYVFQPFRQADRQFSRQFSGLGLGLSICKQLVELHGGKIEASSDGTDRGTTVTIRVPRHASTPMELDRSVTAADAEPVRPLALPLPSTARDGAMLHGIDVLVVDDELDTLELLKQILEGAGATVRTAANPADAVEQWDAREPDLLVTDLGLPTMDGYALLREVRGRSLRTGALTPAVAVTSYARLDDRAATLAAGFQQHIAKPIDPKAFLTAVAAVVAPQD
jgi:PAS domain S-box-containing protein